MTGLLLVATLVTAAPPTEFVPEAQLSREAPATVRAALPPAPPAPMVQLLVLVPADSTPGKDLAYTIQLANPSASDAKLVKVRMPLPDGATHLSSEPAGVVGLKEIVWDLKALNKNETKRIELKLRPNAAATEVNVSAYVSYEFGQAVKTRISPAKLKVTTEVPKQAVSDQPIPVRVRVVNNGRTPIENAKLVETVTEGFEYDRDSAGETTNVKNQRSFDLGTLPAGMGKTIEFRLTTKQGRDLTVTSVASASGLTANDDATTKVGDVKLKVDLRGDAVPAADETATFKATIRNEGTMPLTNVRVVGAVPADCLVTSRTNGGQIGRDQVVWTLPKLAAGEERTLKWILRCSGAGRKTVRAEATADRGITDGSEVQTVFPGAAALAWEQKFDTPTVVLDRQGLLTVKVTNNGTETAKDVKLTLTLPAEVSFIQASPTHKHENEKITFEPRTVRVGTTETYTLTFRGETKGQAYFVAKLAAESLGDKPLTAEKSVMITSVR